jgi:hypothetical protein
MRRGRFQCRLCGKLKTRFQNETRQRGATAPTDFTASSLRSARNFNQLGSGVARRQRIRNFGRRVDGRAAIAGMSSARAAAGGVAARAAKVAPAPIPGAVVPPPVFTSVAALRGLAHVQFLADPPGHA